MWIIHDAFGVWPNISCAPILSLADQWSFASTGPEDRVINLAVVEGGGDPRGSCNIKYWHVWRGRAVDPLTELCQQKPLSFLIKSHPRKSFTCTLWLKTRFLDRAFTLCVEPRSRPLNTPMWQCKLALRLALESPLLEFLDPSLINAPLYIHVYYSFLTLILCTGSQSCP